MSTVVDVMGFPYRVEIDITWEEYIKLFMIISIVQGGNDRNGYGFVVAPMKNVMSEAVDYLVFRDFG